MRGGFQVTETAAGAPPDFLLYTPDAALSSIADEVRALVTRPEYGGAPLFVLLGEGRFSTATEALLAGARDALVAPIHLPELRARLDVHIRMRTEVREAQDALRARDLLFDIFQEVSSALRADEIFQTLVRRVGQAFGLSHCSFVLTTPGDENGRVVAVYENPAIRDLRVDLARYPEIQEAIRTERPVVIQNVHEHPLFASIREHWSKQQLDVNVQAAVALPVFVQGRAAGVFFLRTEKGDPQLRAADVAFANTIAQAAARVLENEERRSAIYRRQISAGTTDELTGCASLDALDRRLRDEFERARRYSLHFSLVLVDIDRLRDINERHGHAAGDRVLGEIGAILQRELRAPDFVARYGGDEFACVLPETDGPGGRHFVGRLRQVLARHTFADLGPSQTPAISAGVVAYPHNEALRPEDLFTLAESALQQAKDVADRVAVVGE
ncbi:MAG TPA: sensor domain-containing diguanylate cyclase [Myxococcales bacterium]|nr:sensor domain-containing diguanylate cyclase [Myxococcales bacterium]